MSRRAVVIGINKYQDPTDLIGCVRDAREVTAALSMPEYGFDTNLLVDEQATRRSCLDALWQTAELNGEFFAIYFAGHGGISNFSGYLASHDGVPRDPGIRLSELAEIMSAASVNYEHVAAILDSCHSGAATPWVDHHPLTANAVSNSIEAVNTSRLIMAACRPEQSAWETNGPVVQGEFTKLLVDGLLGDAVDFNGNISMHSLFDHINGKIDPELQTPVFRGDSAGSVILGRGFTPRSGAPIDDTKQVEIQAKAQRLLDEYRSLYLREMSNMERKRDGGLSKCSTVLEDTLRWFSDIENRDGDIKRSDEWQKARLDLRNYQVGLASISNQDQLPMGRVVDNLGEGGFGQVWKVEADPGIYQAYKVFHGSEINEAVKAKRFRYGYFSMKQLNHPQIVKVDRLTEAPLGFTMAFIDGPDLRRAYIDRTDAQLLLAYVQDIADTIRFAHDSGVIHRDIKPENVLLEWNESQSAFNPVLTDFDLAYIETNRTVTIAAVGGAINYAAPEQFYTAGNEVVRAFTVDIYALAQLMYYIIVGTDPSSDNSQKNKDQFSRVVNSLFDYEVSPILRTLYDECTSWRPSDRPQAMLDVCNALTRARLLQAGQSDKEYYSGSEICSRVAFAYLGHDNFEGSGSGVNLRSRSGALDISLDARGGGTEGASNFVLRLYASQKLAVPGANSRTHARQIFDNRIDKMLSRIEGARRHPLNRGYYSTEVRVESVPLTLDGATRLSEVISDVVSSIEKLD